MNKRYYSILLALFFVLLLMAPGARESIVSMPAQAQTAADPQQALEQAWERVREAGSYRFLSTAEQTMVPRPIPEMIGESDVYLTLENDGAVILPDRTYTELRIAGAGQSRSVAVLRDGSQSYMLQDGTLQPVQDALSLAIPTNDLLGYLAGAEQITLLTPPEGHPELTRYGFQLNGESFEEYVREQAEAALQAEPGAPEGLTLSPLPTLQQLSGYGELWVNQAGFPVRQVVDIKMPEVNKAYGAQIHLVVDLSAYGKVEELPQAVQGADGTWHLEGALKTPAAANTAALPGITGQMHQPTLAATNNDATSDASWRAWLASHLPVRIDASILVLFVATVLAILIVRYYRRNPRRCYTLIILFLIPIMAFASLLQAGQVLLFMDRQAQAADKSAAATPKLLRALGLDPGPSDTRADGEPTETAPTDREPATEADSATDNDAPDAAALDSVIGPSSITPLQELGGTEAIRRCGEGSTGDTDGDGLADNVEGCLGTDEYSADTDSDGIDDKTELEGFDLGTTHWDADPLNPDSNNDGIPDGSEWSGDTANGGHANGTAANFDLDGDGIPNLWDDDDDEDGVPDAQDLSPAALTGYTTEFIFSSTGGMVTGTQTIELELQPQEMAHLRYSTTALDWPPDENGNIRDLNNSTADLRLMPFLLVTTNTAPDEDLLKRYGIRSWVDEDGKTVLLVGLQPLEDGGAVYAFYAKVAYAADQTGDIQWDAKLVWNAQMQQDSSRQVYDMYAGKWNTVIDTNPVLVHQYEESFRITGMQISKNESIEAMVMGTPGMPGDDRYLFQLFLGLNATFGSYKTLEGQDEADGETALDEIVSRFPEGYTGGAIGTFAIPSEVVAAARPVVYPNMEAAMVGLGGTQLPDFLDGYPSYTGEALCTDADGNPVTCASLVLATESHSGTLDLSDLADTDPRLVDLDDLSVNLADIPVFALRSVSLRMFERDDTTLTWQGMMPARMLEMIESRYGGSGGAYDTTLKELYPTLRSQDWRFIAYSAYLAAYAGDLLAVSVDGQPLAPTGIDEGLVAEQYTVPDTTPETVLGYMGLASNLPQVLADTFSMGQGAFEIGEVIWNRADFGGANMAGHIVLGGLGAACSVATLVLGSIQTACGNYPDKPVCKNEQALFAANLTMGLISMAVQATAIVYNIGEAIVENLKVVMANFSIAGAIMGFIGAAIGIAMSWAAFGITARHSGDPVATKVNLAMAIVTTIWLLFLACINLIPVAGAIISAILSTIDYIIGLFTGLFTDEQWSIAKILVELFYDARVCTSLESAAFGPFTSVLRDSDLGLVAGNSYVLSLPSYGVIKKETAGENKGTDDDVRKSYVYGVLKSEPDPFHQYTDRFNVQDMSDPAPTPVIVDGKGYFTRTANLGFNLGRPVVNGVVSLYAKMLYATVWAEYMFYGGLRVDTTVETGQLPEEDPDYTKIYLDVLPASLTGLWQWSALGNPDRDGDGLTNDEEIALGTNPDLWDTDGDGLSDKYEARDASARGADPKLADTDNDGLNDGLERRVGTRINVADSDGDALNDGDEVRHLQDGALVGGWRITPPPAAPDTLIALNASLQQSDGYWVSSDPRSQDDDADGLNAWEEKGNGISPTAVNSLVPALKLSAAPLPYSPDTRPGMYWLPGETVTFAIQMANWTYAPVTTTMTLDMPDWLDVIAGGVTLGDRTITPTLANNVLSWGFSETNPLQLYESIAMTVTARVKSDTTSASDKIALDLLYGDIQMHKTIQATVDGDNPEVAIMAPSDGAYLSGTHYVAGGRASDPTTWITERSISIVPKGSTTAFNELPVGQGVWAYTWELPTTDGIYSLQAHATDFMGHETTTTPVEVTVDNTPPVATVTWEMVDGIIHLSGTATDNVSGVVWLQLSIDGQPWRSIPFSGSDWSYDWTVGVSAQGKHEALVRAFDRCGNESDIASAKVIVDRMAPSNTITGGADKDVPPAIKPNTAFYLTGVADEGGHLPQPATSASLRTGMDVFDDSTVWLGISTIHDNDGGVMAAWIGDFNADRMSDLAVGLPSPEGADGFVSILYGRAGGWPVPPDLEMLASTQSRFAGAAGTRLGSLLAAAGDVNADNMDDLLIGERASSRAFLIWGNPSPLGGTTLEAGQSGYRTMFQAPATIEGLASAGDVDGDGYGDLLVVAGGTAYLIMGHSIPWPETLHVAAEAATNWDSVTGALGVGDVDNDQLAEWVVMADGTITLYGWNTSGDVATATRLLATADADPRVAALGDVDGDAQADWMYSSGTSRILVYGDGTTHTFSSMEGFFAAPGDVDGDGRADILLTTSEGVGALIRQQPTESPEVFATVTGVGGAANAPYASGADLNADGSADLLLIPNEVAAEERGFDAPDFSSGFISPQALPLGASTATGESGASPRMLGAGLQSTGPDTRYVDDDGACNGDTPCYTTIQAAVDASDGGGDTIIVYPGVYASFSVPAGTNYDNLMVEGVSADAVFVEGGTADAIHVAADGVRLANLTVRNAKAGVVLEDGAGGPLVADDAQVSLDHLLVHSVVNPIQISQSAVLSVTDSTLVGDGVNPIIKVGSALNTSVYYWHADGNVTDPATTNTLPLTTNGALAGTASTLYAMPGGTDRTVYAATPGAGGALGNWSAAFQVPNEMPTDTGQNLITAGGSCFYQMHPVVKAPDLGATNGVVRAVAVAPNGDIYIGGSFTRIGDSFYANNIARWDGTQWNRLGTGTSNGVDGTVYALTIVSNGAVYVGGRFDRVFDSTGEVPALNIARWDSSGWLTLGEAVVGGNGVSGGDLAGSEEMNYTTAYVYALAHTDDDVVIVGGNFRHFRESLAAYTRGEGHTYNLAFYHPTRWLGSQGATWMSFSGDDIGYIDQSVRSLVWVGGNLNTSPIGTLYAGGNFTYAGWVGANHVARFHWDAESGSWNHWRALGIGIATSVSDVAWDSVASKVYAVSDDSASAGIYQWNGTAWSTVAGLGGAGNAVAADSLGNVYAGMITGAFYVLPSGGTAVELLGSEASQIWDIVPEGYGQVLVGHGDSTAATGGVRRWALAGLFRRDLTTNTWTALGYPSGLGSLTELAAIAADESGNLYAVWNDSADGQQRGRLYSVAADSTTWVERASTWTGEKFKFRKLAWVDQLLYGFTGYLDDGGSGFETNFYSILVYNPTADQWSWKGLVNGDAIDASASVDTVSVVPDGQGRMYTLAPSTVPVWRYDGASWLAMAAPITFDTSKQSVMARVGQYLYAYTADTSTTTNLFRFGMLPLTEEVRLNIERTALVVPDSASGNSRWLSLDSQNGTYAFGLAYADNAWVAASSMTLLPTLPTGATRLTSAQAAFAAPEDGLYRLTADSILAAGYHDYMPVAHVYTTQAACVECTSGSLTWGETAFATMREAVESGATRVLVHPGRYPQSFYLVSGVEVMGSGAENTIIEPPAGDAATLVTAEGVAHATLARMTLAGGANWEGFLAEGGAEGLKLTRNIIRGLDTGVRLTGDSAVEIVNNTIVRNVNGIVAEGTTPVNVRNTILAYNTGIGLQYGSPSSLSNTYNDFWGNATDMDPVDVSLGSMFVDPRFVSLSANNLRLTAGSGLIDAGAPGDPTTPGGGARVDMGYVEYSAAAFYVSKDYSETGLNDGLTWGVDAFDKVQPALDAAAATLRSLQGTVPKGGYTVGVDAGIYTERVTVPSHVRLVGSGAEVTTIDAGNIAYNHGSTVTFSGVIDSAISGFTVQNGTYSSNAGVLVANTASDITISRNVIRNNVYGIYMSGKSSAKVGFNTIVDNTASGVYVSGSGTWAEARNNIIARSQAGLHMMSSGLIRNDYNLLYGSTYNTANLTAGPHTIYQDPLLGTNYVPSAASPAIDAADPEAEVPVAGGVRADLGYKELIACPLTMVFGPQVASTVIGNAGVAKVEMGMVLVTDETKAITETLPTTWETLTPAATDQPLYYWSKSVSQATAGFYRVYSRATDVVGNVETEETDWYEGAFVVDNTAPTVTWGTPTLPSSTDAAVVLAVAEVAGTVSTGTGTRNDVDQVYFSVTGPNGTLAYPAEGGRAWIPLPATGSYTIDAVAIDEAGNQAKASASMVVSASSSVATVSNYVADSPVRSTAATLRGYVRFAAAGTGTVAVSVSGGGTVQATLDAPGVAFSAWSAAITLPAGDGAKTITLTPSLDGTAGTATTLNLTLDTTAPTLSITTPAVGATVAQTMNWTGTASDAGSGLVRVEVSVDGGYTWRQVTVDGSNWSLDWDFPERQDYTSYPAQMRAVDKAGNVATVARTVAVDSVPPTDLTPAIFGKPVGQHLEKGTGLTIGWKWPVDASGTASVYLAVDQSTDTVPADAASGTSSTISLNAIGDWYVHLMVQDAAGNQALYHYGPWHVRDMANTTFSERRQSIAVDGYIDVERDEWLSTDLLGTDAQSLETQQLCASWDGEAIYLGWSGAWWTLDGAMWAYLDVATGGSTQSVGGAHMLPFAADVAVLIDSPESGSLYTWDGSAWVPSTDPLTFANGSSGDSEARIPWSLAADQAVKMVAFALPRQTAESQGTLSIASNVGLLVAEDEGQPWVIFPNTNPLGEDATTPFAWSNPVVGEMNEGQPTARTVLMTVSSPQVSGTAWCAESSLQYVIELTNPEPMAISGLTLNLAATTGLGYQTVSGATRTAGSIGDADWTLTVPTLGAGEMAKIVVTAKLASDLIGLDVVQSTITLSARDTHLTANPEAVVSYRVDGAAPTVTIDALPGAGITAGSHSFGGTANDGNGSGVKLVRVSLDNGATWQTATGTLAWSATLFIPNGAMGVSLQAQAEDNCGRTSAVATQSFSVDTTLPEVSWTVSGVITATLALLTGATSDTPEGALVERVEVQLDRETAAWLAAAGPYAPQNGVQAWNWNWYTPQDDGVRHQLRARATDGVGNRMVTEWQSTVVDVIAPQITVSQQVTSVLLPTDTAASPLSSGPWADEPDGEVMVFLPLLQKGSGGLTLSPIHLLAEPTLLLGGTVTDGSGVRAVRILVYDPLGGSSIESATLANGTWEYTPDLTGWVPGTYALRVEAVDIYNNVRMQGPYPLEVQEQPIAGLTASNDGPKRATQPVTLTAALSAGSKVTYLWTLGDGETATGRVVQHTYAQAGDYVAEVTASNSVSTLKATTPVRVLPRTEVLAGEDQTVYEGDSVSILATFTDAGAAGNHTASVNWGDDSEPEVGLVDEVNHTVSGSHTYLEDGTYTVAVTVTTQDGDAGSDTLQVTVNNVAPTIALSGAASVDEGAAYTMTLGIITDPGDDTVTAWAVDWGDGASNTYSAGGDVTHIYADGPISPTIAVNLTDEDGTHLDAGSLSITVNNVAPVITGITVPLDPLTLNAVVHVNATYSDAGLPDTHTPEWVWSDGSVWTGTAADGVVSGSGTFSVAGIYVVTLTLIDDDGDMATLVSEEYVVIYDPNGGFVTGGGWIMSPPGADVDHPEATGKANFGFVAKYHKGAKEPEGNTEFQFKAGNLDFHSSVYQWLVVAGPKATFKGVGTVNGMDGYGFMLTAWDGQIKGGGGVDKFRIKIWELATEATVYDNQMDAADGADPTTILGGGSIVIHSK